MNQFAKIDRLIHEPARFMLMSHLFVVKQADFVLLTRQTGLSGGNLSSHMSKLEKAGYVNVEKSFVEKRPFTVFKLTVKGRKAFLKYKQMMASALEGASL